jgi:Domain of unknown function (DUF4070)
LTGTKNGGAYRRLTTAFRIVYRLGITDRNRKYFWKLIAWAWTHNRKMLDKAVFYGVMIYQMYETYKTIRAKAMGELATLDTMGPDKRLDDPDKTASATLARYH